MLCCLGCLRSVCSPYFRECITPAIDLIHQPTTMHVSRPVAALEVKKWRGVRVPFSLGARVKKSVHLPTLCLHVVIVKARKQCHAVIYIYHIDILPLQLIHSRTHEKLYLNASIFKLQPSNRFSQTFKSINLRNGLFKNWISRSPR